MLQAESHTKLCQRAKFWKNLTRDFWERERGREFSCWRIIILWFCLTRWNWSEPQPEEAPQWFNVILEGFMRALIFLYNYNNYKLRYCPAIHWCFHHHQASNWVWVFCVYSVCCLLRFNNNVLYQDDLQFSYTYLCHILLSFKRWSFYQGSYLILYKRFILISQHRLLILILKIIFINYKSLTQNFYLGTQLWIPRVFVTKRRMNFFPVVQVPSIAIWDSGTNGNNLHSIWL